MRRVISLALLLIFCYPLISPALALMGGPETNLPACCRRNGAHHCTMMQAADSGGPGIRIAAMPWRCPAFPAVVTQVQHGDVSLPPASLIVAEILSHPALRAQIEARARVTLDRSRQKRGPPSRLL